MKVKLICNYHEKDEIIEKIKDAEFSVTEHNPDFILIDLKFHKDHLIGKGEDSTFVILNASEIMYIECYDNQSFAYVNGKEYTIDEKLYEVEGLFATKGFVRVNKSAVVNIHHIKHIKPTYNTKFIITMNDGHVIDVTRTYYYIFKKYLGL